MAKVGDKFVIEIDEVFMGLGLKNKLYKIKGFNSLVFDDNGIDKLVTYNEMAVSIKRKMLQDSNAKGYAEGFKAGAEAQIKACKQLIFDVVTIGNDLDFLNNMYGGLSIWGILADHELTDVINTYRTYKGNKIKSTKDTNKPHTLCVGDIVKAPGCDNAIVTMIAGDRCHIVGKNFKGDMDLRFVEYTGKHKELFDE